MRRKSEDPSNEGWPAYAHLPWKGISIVSSLIAIAALSTVVIQVATTNADLLSSVALILAVLAFVIQIIVFTADFTLNARRDKEASQLNAATLALLAKIEEKANSTNQAVDGQMTKLIDNLLLRDKFESKSGPVSPENEVRREVLNELRETIVQTPSDGRGNSSARPDSAPASLRRAADFTTWPRELTLKNLAKEGIDRLTIDELRLMVRFGRDVVESADGLVPEGLPDVLIRDETARDSLHQGRFIRRAYLEGIDERGWRLTGMGFAAARLFVAPDPIPARAAELMPWLEERRSSLGEHL